MTNMLMNKLLVVITIVTPALALKFEPKDNTKCEDIHKPNKADYNLWKPNLHGSAREWFSQDQQDKRLARLFEKLNITTGFFVESGAADGETNSNSLHFEMMKGWTGLLVEPHPRTFQALLKKNRKAHAFNGALSTSKSSETMNLEIVDCVRGAEDDGECSHMVAVKGADKNKQNFVEVPTAPLEKLLDCLERSTVDLWSLDVEGAEGDILKSFPFEQKEVGVLVIEMNKGKRNNEKIEEIMKNNGFQECARTVLDRFYVNPSYFIKRKLQTPATC